MPLAGATSVRRRSVPPTKPSSIRLLLVDDHEVVRVGLRTVLHQRHAGLSELTIPNIEQVVPAGVCTDPTNNHVPLRQSAGIGLSRLSSRRPQCSDKGI